MPSAKQVLRTEFGERIDQPDFQFGQDIALNHARQNIEGLQSGLSSFLISGFQVTDAGGTILTITKDSEGSPGKAVLAFRGPDGVEYGHVLADGDASRQFDLSTLTAETYNVYVSLDLANDAFQNRAFWNADQSAGGPVEFTRNVPTRTTAGWKILIDVSTNTVGPEWMPLAQIVWSGAAITGNTDLRSFYFEGDVAASYAPSNEWGDGANDRDADRAQYGIKDQRMLNRALMRQIADIIGLNWWETSTVQALLTSHESRLDTFDLQVIAGRNNIIAVGPTGSNANFTGDDETPFIAALAALPTNGGTIIVLPGTYTFAARVDVSKNNVTFKGTHPGASVNPQGDLETDSTTIVQLDNSFRGTAGFGGLFHVTTENVSFEDMTFKDTGTLAAAYDALVYWRYQQLAGLFRREGFKFFRCGFSNDDGGGTGCGTFLLTNGFDDIREADNIIIEQCYFQGTFANVAIDLNDVRNFTFQDNVIEVRSSAPMTAYFMDLFSGQGTGLKVVIKNNMFRGYWDGGTSGWIRNNIHTGSSLNKALTVIEGNVFTNESATFANANGALQIAQTGSLDQNVTYICKNLMSIPNGAAGGRVLDTISGASDPGILYIDDNEILYSDLALPMFVSANQLMMRGNHITGLMGAWISDLGPAPQECILADNIFDFLGGGALSNFIIPSNSKAMNNIFDRQGLGSGGTVQLNQFSEFIGNTVDYSQFGIAAGVDALVLTTGGHQIVKGNFFHGTTTRDLIAIRFNSNATTYVQIIGNRFENWERCIFADGATDGAHWIVDSNMCETVTVFCDLSGADYCTISNNVVDFNNTTVTSLGTYGVACGDHCVVKGNVFQDMEGSTGDVTERIIVSIGHGVVQGNIYANMALCDIGVRITGTLAGPLVSGDRFHGLGTNRTGNPTVCIDNSGATGLSVTGVTAFGCGNGSNPPGNAVVNCTVNAFTVSVSGCNFGAIAGGGDTGVVFVANSNNVVVGNSLQTSSKTTAAGASDVVEPNS